jgi:hypothetical protein
VLFEEDSSEDGGGVCEGGAACEGGCDCEPGGGGGGGGFICARAEEGTNASAATIASEAIELMNMLRSRKSPVRANKRIFLRRLLGTVRFALLSSRLASNLR